MRFPSSSSSETSDIQELQRALVACGSDIVVDGVLGPKTAAAVIVFQEANRLTVDGIVGEITWTRLTVTVRIVPAPVPVPGPFAGFDTFGYPGDAAMQT